MQLRTVKDAHKHSCLSAVAAPPSVLNANSAQDLIAYSPYLLHKSIGMRHTHACALCTSHTSSERRVASCTACDEKNPFSTMLFEWKCDLYLHSHPRNALCAQESEIRWCAITKYQHICGVFVQCISFRLEMICLTSHLQAHVIYNRPLRAFQTHYSRQNMAAESACFLYKI